MNCKIRSHGKSGYKLLLLSLIASSMRLKMQNEFLLIPWFIFLHHKHTDPMLRKTFSGRYSIQTSEPADDYIIVASDFSDHYGVKTDGNQCNGSKDIHNEGSDRTRIVRRKMYLACYWFFCIIYQHIPQCWLNSGVAENPLCSKRSDFYLFHKPFSG